MSGKKLFILLIAVFCLNACSQKKSPELQEQELTQLIDKKEYAAVLKWFELEEDAEAKERLKIFQAYAYMGLGKLDTMGFAARVRGEQNFSDPKLQGFFRNCPPAPLPFEGVEVNKCISLRLFNQAPAPDEPNLRQAQAIFRNLFLAHRLSPQGVLVMTFLESVLVFSRLKGAFLMYVRLNANTMTRKQLDFLFNELHTAGKDMESWVNAVKHDKQALTEKLTGIQGISIFQGEDKDPIDFADATGIPLMLRVTDTKDESTLAQAGRNILIQALDEAEVFYDQ